MVIGGNGRIVPLSFPKQIIYIPSGCDHQIYINPECNFKVFFSFFIYFIERHNFIFNKQIWNIIFYIMLLCCYTQGVYRFLWKSIRNAIFFVFETESELIMSQYLSSVFLEFILWTFNFSTFFFVLTRRYSLYQSIV